MSFKNKINTIHIISWLIKDIFWCMKIVSMATFMIIPTLFLTGYILITQKDNVEENLVLSSWVLMNVMWLMHELHDWSKFPVFLFMIAGVVFSFFAMKSCLKKSTHKKCPNLKPVK